jgi:UDP-N-acetylglucosamine 3-dehydrogenase
MRVAVIGLGAMGRHHARCYTEIPGVTLAAAADPDPTAMEAAIRLGARAYGSAEDLLRSEELDAVSVCAPTRQHREIALRCLEAGLHVLVEKPIAATVEDAEDILRAAERSGRVLMVGHIERFNPAVRALRRLIAEGRLGTLLQLHFQRLGLRPRAAPDVPVVVDLGVHDLDLAACLCGAPLEDITALGGRAALGVPDYACLLARCGAAAVTIQLSWVTPIKLRRVIACGTDGYAELNLVTQDLRWFHRDTGGDEPATFPEFVARYGRGAEAGVALPFPEQGREPLRIELEEFLGAARFGWTVPASGQDALQALRLALEASRQIAAAEPVPWPA